MFLNEYVVFVVPVDPLRSIGCTKSFIFCFLFFLLFLYFLTLCLFVG